MAKLYVSSVIEAPVERVWEFIRDFNGLPKWFPGVTDSHIEEGKPGDQVGCVRDFGLEGGGRMREQLLALSDHEHVCTYKMLATPVPMSFYQATVRLLRVTDGDRTFAELASEFVSPPEQESALAAFLSSAYQGSFELLKKHCGSGKSV